MINRMERIKEKGFDMSQTHDFSKIKVGLKSIQDANFNIGSLKTANAQLSDKAKVLKAIANGDVATLREISDFFYRTSGIYNRLCRYLAYMYRYDWMVVPYINDLSEKRSVDKALTDFHSILYNFDNFSPKKFFGEVALKVVKFGEYYGYKIVDKDSIRIQELPVNYCRSRFTNSQGRPVVEFNMKYFDDAFADVGQRQRILKIFPSEFLKGYVLFKEGKLTPDFQGDQNGWYLLEGDAFRFNINNDIFPVLISVVPALIELDEAQGLERKKMEQQLLKIIVQKMPIDKNGELVFDVVEAQQLHNNAVGMIGKAVGVDVLTTFADVAVEDMTHSTAATADNKSMDRVKAAVYDQSGSAQNLFNSTGNLSLEKSVLNDEASMYNLVQQFEMFCNQLLEDYNTKPKKYYFRAYLLPTTIYNYKDLAKLYKELVTLGYSKVLPQIALGVSQSAVLANAYFENNVLDLVNVLIPPLSSNTMSGKIDSSENKGGRPTNEEKGEANSDKTLQNKESQN